MSKLWPWRRSARPAVPARPQPDNWVNHPDDLPYGPYASVDVIDESRAKDGFGSLVSTRSFDDPDEAALVQTAWQRHAPELIVKLHHPIRSSHRPSYEGSYLQDGTWHDGQPAAIDALIETIKAEVEEQAKQRAQEKERLARELAALNARLEARRPKTVVVAATGDDSPVAHHDKFVKATRTFVEGRPVDQPRFEFTAFSGREPKPVSPSVPADVRGSEQDRERLQLIRAEYAEALRLWTAAAYRLKAGTALRAAADAWPAVAAAFTRIEQAWADLDHPPHGWEVAVKQLLDAHDEAKKPVSDWEYVHARQLATLGADLVDGEDELEVLRARVGAELGIDEVKDWRIGRADDYYGDGRYIDVKDGARAHLEHLVSSQRARLAEITTAAGRVTT